MSDDTISGQAAIEQIKNYRPGSNEARDPAPDLMEDKKK